MAKAKKRKVGRPNRAERSAKAKPDFGVDPETVQLERILASIASDPTQPATARVQACRELRAIRGGGDGEAESHSTGGVPTDGVSQRAVELLNGRGRPQ